MALTSRATIGKRKGQFIKKIKQKQILNFVEKTSGKQGRLINSEQKKSENKNNYDSVAYKKFYGRRVVEMDKLAQDLWCKVCKHSVSLQFLLEEKQQGIASKIKVQCHTCLNIIVAETSSKSNKYFYDSNLKLATGMLDAGMGETAVNTFISALNIPVVGSNSLKRYERRVGSSIEKLAEESCIEAIVKEKSLASNHNMNKDYLDPNNDVADLIASFDAAWPKRGRQRNSFSGHASLIGHFSNKVIAYACRNIYCKQCSINKKVKHDCRKNYSGTSKSMEADMAVQLILKNEHFVNMQCRVKVIIGDDDSSAIAALRRLSPYAIEKWSDFNHTKKTFNSKLYDIKLSAFLREYFSKVFSLAIKQNKGDVQQVKHALENIVPHAFGNHEKCGSFCLKSDNGTHLHKYFKNGQCLSDEKLKQQLKKILEPFVNSSMSIAPCGSSQPNESFNNTVCSKHPKALFYGGSESHCYRVATAVCQKNLGYEYIVKLNSSLNLSPGEHSKRSRKHKEDRFIREAETKSSIPIKRRRLELKKKRSCKNLLASNREGVSYQSGSGYLNTADLIDEVLISENVSYENCKIVIFDIETTGFQMSDEIVQIAAVCENDEFNVYLMPKRSISQKASEVTNLKICNKKMYYKEKQVLTLSPRDGLLSFLYFLKRQYRPVILLAHNCYRFDAPRIIQLALTVDLIKELKLFVTGFCDSLYVFKSLLTQRKKFSQGALAEDYLDKSDIQDAHNALNDVIILKKLLAKICHDKINICKHAQNFDFIVNAKDRNEKIKTCKNSLKHLQISTNMKSKLSKAGINITILEKAYETGGYDGLAILLRESVQGKPRVTNNSKIIKSIFTQLSK